MKLRNKLIFSSVLMILGATISCIAGIMAENHPIGDMPAFISVIGFIGLICFLGGLCSFVFNICLGDD